MEYDNSQNLSNTENLILVYLREKFQFIEGNYFELGTHNGLLVKMMARAMSDKTFYILDSDPEDKPYILQNILGFFNVYFYHQPFVEFNQDLNNPAIVEYNASTFVFNNGMKNEEYDDGLRIAERLLNFKPGIFIFVETPQAIIDEFMLMLGHRVTVTQSLADNVLVFELRAQ